LESIAEIPKDLLTGNPLYGTVDQFLVALLHLLQPRLLGTLVVGTLKSAWAAGSYSEVDGSPRRG